MNWKEDKRVLDFMLRLKHGSATIQNDINDAFDEAETFEEFKQQVRTRMEGMYHRTNQVMYDLDKIELTSEVATSQDIKDLVITTLEQVVKELDAIKTQINREYKKLRTVHVIVEEYEGISDSVMVYSDERKADEHYVNFIKKHYGTEEEYKDQLEHGAPENIITHHVTEVK